MPQESENPHILLIGPGLPPNSMAGTEQHVHSLAAKLQAEFEVLVLCRDARGPEPESDNQHIVRIPPASSLGSVDELVAHVPRNWRKWCSNNWRIFVTQSFTRITGFIFPTHWLN